MNKANPTIFIFLTLLLLNACGTISEGLGDSKKKGSEEFLVEKKAPLVLPPNYEELPEPEVKKDENLELIQKNTLSIEKMIGQSSSISSNIENNESNSSIEKSIIEKINKKKIKKENSDEMIVIPKKKNIFQKLREKFN
tara:strand:- start:547 stop:963 length:417 start_codon:yes stop_codon:yes gene_type:complete